MLSSTKSVSCDDLVVCEILSRLPVKSLMRFKCVCKSWKFLIEKDEHFIDLHFTRSKSRTFILIKTPGYGWDRDTCFLSAELSMPSEDGLDAGGATFQRQIPRIELGIQETGTHMLDLVHGLVCFANDTHCFCICNPSTRESTPWIKSLICQEQKDQKRVVSEDGTVAYTRTYLNLVRWSYFGYNPATKEYKVLSLWLDTIGLENICEVLTVGAGKQYSFRIVELDYGLMVSPAELDKSVYVNGSIYLSRTKTVYGVEPSIIEFNCATEKFSVISFPSSFFADDVYISWVYIFRLLEVDGRLALLAKNCGEYSEDNHASMKMYLLHDNDDQDQDSQSSNCHWVKETFLMPPCEWNLDRKDSIIPIPGTDFFIVRSATTKNDYSFYYYNWKKKKFSSNKVEIDGISSFLVPPGPSNLFYHQYYFYASTENLLPVN